MTVQSCGQPWGRASMWSGVSSRLEQSEYLYGANSDTARLLNGPAMMRMRAVNLVLLSVRSRAGREGDRRRVSGPEGVQCGGRDAMEGTTSKSSPT